MPEQDPMGGYKVPGDLRDQVRDPRALSLEEAMRTRGMLPEDRILAQIEHWFTYHAPKSDQIEAYQAIRDAGKSLALVIATRCPSSPDRTAAIRRVREAVMTANASIACEEP